MNASEIKYKTKTADEKTIAAHLHACDIEFIPALSLRVNIEEYAKKIFENAITFEAWNENTLAGMIAVYFNHQISDTGFITNVSVVKNYSGKGIATALLNMCIEYARQKDFYGLELEVNFNNNEAISFYKKFNFVIVETKDEILLIKLAVSK